MDLESAKQILELFVQDVEGITTDGRSSGTTANDFAALRQTLEGLEVQLQIARQSHSAGPRRSRLQRRSGLRKRRRAGHSASYASTAPYSP